MRIFGLTTAIALTVLTVGCGGGGKSAGIPSPVEGCKGVTAPSPKPDVALSKPTAKLDPNKRYIATVSTSCGTFDVRLDVKRAPKTSASFKYLADEGVYDGLLVHRIVAGFMMQTGDPLGDGSGGPGYKVVEKPPSDLEYSTGVVAMAKAGNEAPGTSGSQFFVMLSSSSVPLPPEYALAGQVITGQEVVDRIGTLGAADSAGTPVAPVLLESVRVAVQ